VSTGPTRRRSHHIRTENVNLHTTFPRTFRLLKPRLGPTILAFVGAAGFVLAGGEIGWRYLVVQTAAVGAPLLALLLFLSVPISGSGSFSQWVKQRAGSTGYLYDGYQALTSPPGLLVRGVVPAVLLLLGSGAVGRLATQYWPGRWGVALGVGTFLLGIYGFIGWVDRIGRGLGRRRSPALPEQVKRLSMVQALSWTSLPKYPGEARGPQRPLVFVSSFNEGLDGYVGGFVEGMQETLSGPWGQAPGFPRVADGFRPFLEYVARTSHPIDHSFLAYPHLSVTDVRSALLLDRAYRSLRTAHLRTPFTTADFEQFLDRVRLALGSLPPPIVLDPAVRPIELCAGPAESENADPCKPSTAKTETTIFVSALPLPCDALDEVLDGIAELLPGGTDEGERIYEHARSPFNRVAGTHTARLLVVDRWVDPADPRARIRPRLHFEDERAEVRPIYDWLVFSAQFDNADGKAGIADWLRRVHDSIDKATIRKIWKPAASLIAAPGLDPGSADHFVALIQKSIEEPTVRVVDHEQNTVWDVLRAAHTHRLVTGYLVAQRDPHKGFLTRPRILPHRRCC